MRTKEHTLIFVSRTSMISPQNKQTPTPTNMSFSESWNSLKL